MEKKSYLCTLKIEKFQEDKKPLGYYYRILFVFLWIMHGIFIMYCIIYIAISIFTLRMSNKSIHFEIDTTQKKQSVILCTVLGVVLNRSTKKKNDANGKQVNINNKVSEISSLAFEKNQVLRQTIQVHLVQFRLPFCHATADNRNGNLMGFALFSFHCVVRYTMQNAI